MVKNKTIIFFNGFFLPHLGGVETYTSALIEELKKDYNIIVVTSNVPKSKSYEEKAGVKIFRLPVKNFFKERFPVPKKNAEYKDLIKRIKAEKVDYVIINTRYYYTTFEGLKLAKLKNIRPIIIDHSSDYILKPYERFCLPKILKYNPKFYAVSKKTASWLETLGIKTQGIFYNAVKVKDFKKPKNPEIRLAFAGRLLEEKGIKLVLESFNELKNRFNLEFVVIGDGPLYSTLKEEYKDVCFTGFISKDEVLKELEKTDIFLYPTLYPEGFPTVVLEAASKKCAVLATDRGGIAELIDDSSGIILKENAEDLTDKLEKLLKEPEKIRKYGEKIFQKVSENFTLEKTAEKVRKELEND